MSRFAILFRSENADGEVVAHEHTCDRVTLRSPEGFEICIVWSPDRKSFTISTESLVKPHLTVVDKVDLD